MEVVKFAQHLPAVSPSTDFGAFRSDVTSEVEEFRMFEAELIRISANSKSPRMPLTGQLL